MKQFLSGLIFVVAIVCGLSTTLMAQVPSVVVAPIPSTCAGFNTTLHYSATNSPTAYSITWTGSPTGLPDVAPGTFLPPITIPITVLSTCAAGTYYGSLIISNTSGGSTPMTISVTVYANPVVFSVTGGGRYCSGGTGVDVALSGSETGVQYQLYHGGVAMGSSVWGSGSALDFGNKTLSGSYTAVGTNAYTGCVSNMSSSATVSINPVPTVVAVTGGGGYCAGGAGVNVGLSASVFGNYYQLYRGVTAIGTPLAGIGMALDFGPQTTPGTYTVIAVDSSGPCTANMSGSANVYIYPQPTVYNVTGGGSYCFGGYGVDVGLTGSNSGIVYKLFNSGSVLMGTLTGTGSALDFGLQTPDGPYTVKAINTVYGCTLPMADTAYITYIPDTTPSVTVAAKTIICNGTIDTFKAIPVNGGSAPTYTWTLNGAFAAYGSTYVHMPSNGDIVQVSMTSNASCAIPATVSSFVSMNVKANIIPTVVVNAFPGTTIINGTTENLSAVIINGGVAPTYQWLVNGVIAAGANTPSFSTNAFHNGDSVTCLVYGCNDTPGHASVIIHVLPRAGVAEINAASGNIRIAPNPGNGNFVISGEVSSDNNMALRVTDMLGKTIYSGNVTVSNGKINEQLQLNGIPAGMYLLNLHSDADNFVTKIIVE
jgi:Secretion system C-terminal sorting domain